MRVCSFGTLLCYTSAKKYNSAASTDANLCSTKSLPPRTLHTLPAIRHIQQLLTIHPETRRYSQVHRAVSHDGKQLAVKVQHEGLRETAYADIVTIEMLVRALHYVLPNFDYTWLVETTKENLPLVGAAEAVDPRP